MDCGEVGHAHPDAHARRPLETIAQHVLLPYAAPLSTAHDRLAPLVTADVLRAIVPLVPDAWLPTVPSVGGASDQGDAYVRYLLTRVAARDALVTSIEEVRRAA